MAAAGGPRAGVRICDVRLPAPPLPPPVVEPPLRPAPPAVPQLLTQTIDLAPSPPAVAPGAAAPVRVETAVIGAAIEIEQPSILPQGVETRRVQEVTLPASVVLSWSLFVLLGITLAFVAGLLMGHFLWTSH